MKKGWKIFWITCGVMTCVGIMMCAAGLLIGVSREEVGKAIGRGVFSIHSYEKSESVNVQEITDNTDESYPSGAGEQFGNIRNLDVEVGRRPVYVEIYDGDQLRVECDDLHKGADMHKGAEIRCYQEGDTLKIEERRRDRKLRQEGAVHIFVPRDVVFQKAEFSIGAGFLRTDRLAADEIEIECGAGEVDFTAAGKEKDYNYEIEMGAGEVTIGGGRFSGLGMEKEIRNHARKSISVECGAGAVGISFEE